MILVNSNNPSVTVELIIEDAELRIGEIKRKIVIYKRHEKYYARTKEEFDAKFRRLGPRA